MSTSSQTHRARLQAALETGAQLVAQVPLVPRSVSTEDHGEAIGLRLYFHRAPDAVSALAGLLNARARAEDTTDAYGVPVRRATCVGVWDGHTVYASTEIEAAVQAPGEDTEDAGQAPEATSTQAADGRCPSCRPFEECSCTGPESARAAAAEDLAAADNADELDGAL